MTQPPPGDTTMNLQQLQGSDLAFDPRTSLQSVERHEDPLPRHLPQLRALAELIAAESAHALRDRAAREAHLQNVIALPTTRQLPGLLEAVEAARLSAARWALSDRDAPGALNWLASLPQAVAMISLNPARATGLDDRGEIADGKRADLVQVRFTELPSGQRHQQHGPPRHLAQARRGAADPETRGGSGDGRCGDRRVARQARGGAGGRRLRRYIAKISTSATPVVPPTPETMAV